MSLGSGRENRPLCGGTHRSETKSDLGLTTSSSSDRPSVARGKAWARTCRIALLGTVAAAPLMLYGARQVRAQTVPPAPPCDTVVGTTVTCTGDLSAGVFSSGDTYDTINVNTITSNIAPAAGIIGISLVNTNFNAFINSNTENYSISTTGNNTRGIVALSLYGYAQITSSGNVSTVGYYSAAIVAAASGPVSVNSTGDIFTTGALSDGILAGGSSSTTRP